VISDLARKLITSHGMAQSTVRLQPGSFKIPGSFTNVKTNARERRMSVTFPATADVPVVVFHGLGFPPSAATKIGANVACQVYNDVPFPSTSRVVVVKCDTASAVVDLLIR